LALKHDVTLGEAFEFLIRKARLEAEEEAAKKIKELEDRIQELEDRLKSAQRASKRVEDLQGEVSRLQGELKEAEAKAKPIFQPVTLEEATKIFRGQGAPLRWTKTLEWLYDRGFALVEIE